MTHHGRVLVPLSVRTANECFAIPRSTTGTASCAACVCFFLDDISNSYSACVGHHVKLTLAPILRLLKSFQGSALLAALLLVK
jgi:hypothetical protein